MTGKVLDVTGQWDGQFSYPHTLTPEFFSASLFEAGSHVGGTVTERATSGANAGQCFIAMVRGERTSTQVRFTKMYEDGVRQHAVLYRGTLNADGSEIEGEWHIAGSWSGPFLMIRRAAGSVVAEIRVAETPASDADCVTISR
ncbi:hypothetical protein [Komagataeibacter diospyri]|uniref:DUF1579 domain-containing protein n=1 Tax=Komagataeibacter diospyri TaxID=1932662 RepID=A0A4P5NWJ8_9PROT|nr:hypothetical protein [Komagataeibacter diospyri]GCE84331.1 hypothetical protein MSKU9_2472 [Komagataeibacter diospyri]